MLLYHGSTEIIEFPKLIKSDRFLDFGNGFYTTTNLEQAIRWASIKKRRTEADTAYVFMSWMIRCYRIRICLFLSFGKPMQIGLSL